MMDKTIIRNFLSSEISEELFEAEVGLSLGLSKDDIYEYDIVERKKDLLLDERYSSEVHTISILEIQKLLDSAKDKGATHVGIFYHEDHLEYEVYGYNYNLPDKQSIQDEIERLQQLKLDIELRKRQELLTQARRLGLEHLIKQDD